MLKRLYDVDNNLNVSVRYIGNNTKSSGAIEYCQLQTTSLPKYVYSKITSPGNGMGPQELGSFAICSKEGINNPFQIIQRNNSVLNAYPIITPGRTSRIVLQFDENGNIISYSGLVKAIWQNAVRFSNPCHLS